MDSNFNYFVESRLKSQEVMIILKHNETKEDSLYLKLTE